VWRWGAIGDSNGAVRRSQVGGADGERERHKNKAPLATGLKERKEITVMNIAPNQAERNAYPCRKCGKPIYWHKSKTGKNYPCDSATDRRDFHKCEASQQQSAPSPTPPTPTFDSEPTVEQRLRHLEEQVRSLVRTVKAVEARQPIGDSDVPIF
jgi:hypothetical protein